MVSPQLTAEEEHLVNILRNNSYWHAVRDCLDRAKKAESLNQLRADLEQAIEESDWSPISEALRVKG